MVWEKISGPTFYRYWSAIPGSWPEIWSNISNPPESVDLSPFEWNFYLDWQVWTKMSSQLERVSHN
jgi:hypothetical protein